MTKLSWLAALSLAACGTDDPAGPTLLAAFDPTRGELPEGIAVHDGTAYVGMIHLGRVDRVEPDGTHAPFGTLPAGGEGTFVIGVAADPGGDVYALYGNLATPQISGVYRIPASGGAGVQFAGHEEMMVPNDLDFADDGSLFVSDSVGAIFKFANGEASVWSRDPLLAPGGTCGAIGGNFPLGANGISHDGNSVVVANTERATLVRIPINPDGSAGTGELVAGPDCDRLFGIDGIVADTDGSWLVAVQRTNSVARVRADGSIAVLASGGVLDSPASLDLDGGRLLVTASAFESAEDPAATPRPGLVELTLD